MKNAIYAVFSYHAPPPRFPIPDSRFPIPDSRFPIPDSRFPIPYYFIVEQTPYLNVLPISSD
ncbi:MAG: hypothetical protein F6K55_26125 [Moorea sp. SIO4A3]|nr:hypothetical protein [Moorena sp. SIO4A3]